jgi:hypothetical protein
MNKLLVVTIALVPVFSMPASAALAAGSPPRFRAIPDVSRNQVQSTEQRSQSRDATGQINDLSALEKK